MTRHLVFPRPLPYYYQVILKLRKNGLLLPLNKTVNMGKKELEYFNSTIVLLNLN